MATPLRLADHALHACDVKQEAAAGFVAVNGTACNSQADMAVRCELVLSVVVKAVQTETVRFGGTAQQMFM